MEFSNLAVVGSQWGDEGKGKITDFLAEHADVIVRYQGGPNAGHTIVVGDEVFKLHHIPSGVLYPDKICVLGDGMALDPVILRAELENLKTRGIITERLWISYRAHLVLPYHKKQDELEEGRRTVAKIGTTMRGIGPAYSDKYSRQGLRCCDLLDVEDFKKKMRQILEVKNEIFTRLYGVSGIDPEEIEKEYLPAARELIPYLKDTSVLINQEMEKGSKILFEGAQGSMLDIDHGTYPYVTSSNPVAGGICTGAGISPGRVGAVLGVIKAYTTRVGGGPFPTELKDATGDWIREKGREYGTTTGRPRRIGWLDAVALRHAVRINGFRFLAVTLLDVLTGLEKVKIATAYRYGNELVEHFPASLHILEQCQPVYTEFEGWNEDIKEAKKLVDLPQNARKYLQGMEEILGVKVALVSVGPRRDQTIVIYDKLK